MTRSFKLLALDIDGTVLDNRKEVRPRVRQAIRAAVAAGCTVTLATGRRLRSARQVAEELGIKTPLILYTGSLVYDTAIEKALYHRPWPVPQLKEVIAAVLEAGLRPAVLQSPLRGEYIYLGPSHADDPYSRDFALSPLRSDLIKRVSDDQLALVPDVLTISVPGPARLIQKLEAEIPAKITCNVYSYSLVSSALPDLHGFDLIQPQVSKARALLWLSDRLNIKRTEILAIGDGANDLDMLQAAGLGLAMGNAEPTVKACVSEVLPTNEEDGVAVAIEHYIIG